MELTELFTNFFVKYDIDEIEDTTVSGWNHERPAIGFFNSNGTEVANITDECLYRLNDCSCAVNENGNEIYVDEDDEDFKKSRDVFETHCPTFHSSVDNVCGLYNTVKPDADVEEIAKEINAEIANGDMYIDVYYKKDNNIIDDSYEYFNNECFKMFKPIFKEAIKEARKLKKLLHIKKAGAAWHKCSAGYTWKEFKEEYDIPMSWTKAAFTRKVKSAEIKTLYFYGK